MQAAEAKKAAEQKAAEAERGRLVAAGNSELLNFHTSLEKSFSSLKQEIETTFSNRRPYKENSGLLGNFFGPDDSLFSEKPTADRLDELDTAAQAALLNLFDQEFREGQEIIIFGSDDLQSLKAKFADLVCRWNLVDEYEKRFFSNYHMFSGRGKNYQPINSVKNYQITMCYRNAFRFVETNTMIEYYLDRGKFPREMTVAKGSSMIIPEYLFDTLARNRPDTAENDYLIGDRVTNISNQDILIPIGIENDRGMLWRPPERFVPSSSKGTIIIDEENKCRNMFDSLREIDPFFSSIKRCMVVGDFQLIGNKKDSYFVIGFDELPDEKRYLNYTWGYFVDEFSNSLNELLEGRKVQGSFEPFGESSSPIEPWILFADPFRTKKPYEFDRLKQISGSLFVSEVKLTYDPVFDGEDIELNGQLEIIGTLPSRYGKEGGTGALTLTGKDALPFIKLMMKKAN